MNRLSSLHPLSRRAARVTLVAVAALTWSACSGAPPAAPANLPNEASVKPGINDSFLAAEDAAQFATRFETESREVYTQRRAIAAAIGIEPGSAIADIGSGTGLFLSLFSEAVGAEGKVYAVDIAPAMVAWIAQRIRREEFQNVKPVQCTAKSVELPENSVDTVFVCDTYHHFEYPFNTLASIRRALRPGGQLVIVDFHRIEGVSKQWTLDHVRAGEEVVRQEVLDAGFEFVDGRHDLLEENWFARFRKTSP